MRKQYINGVARAALVSLLFGISMTLGAMPTAEEIAAAEPLVQEVMKAEMDALRSGKKTREQVGDAAASLAKQAQTTAEKYILLTGAFEQYARGGAYEKANDALVALRTAIPDWKQSEELALIEKSLRSVAYGKGGPVRVRYEALKERQQYAVKLKNAQAQAQAKPTDKKLQFQIAAYSALLDDWPAALNAFIAGSNPACADAAKLEKEAASPGKIADAWWTASNLKPDFLSSAIRAHAVEFYKKALADPTFAGLQRVAAEKRIKEHEAELAAASAPAPQSSSVVSKRNPYVTKGLVAMWDGEWNAGLGRHDGSARVWKDIVGKSDGKPIGSTSFSNKSVLLDGSSYWEIIPSQELLSVLLNPSVTCEVVLRFGKGAVAKNEGFIGFGKSSSRVIWGYAWGGPMGPEASIVFQHKGSPISQYWRAKGHFDGLHTMVISANNHDVSGLIDAKVCVKTKSEGASNPTPCYIGYIDGYSKMVGEIYCVRIYNRALDAKELQANHAIDVKRFGTSK